MKCPKCDREIRDGFRYCPACGFPIKKVGTSRGSKKWRLPVAIITIIALVGTGVGIYFGWVRDGRDSFSKGNTEVEAQEYEVLVEIPDGTLLDLEQTQLVYGLEGETQIEDPEGNRARAKVTMNDQATGLITLRNENKEEDLLLCVFPKSSEYLEELTPEVNAQSTAQALVFLQPSVAQSDPVLARIILETLQQLPEIKELACYIEERMPEDAAVISHEDGGLQERIAQAYLAYLNLTAKPERNAHQVDAPAANANMLVENEGFDFGGSPSAAYTTSIEIPRAQVRDVDLEEMDLTTNAGINVNMTYDSDTMLGHFEFTNHRTWPGVALIKKGSDLGSGEGAEFLAYIPPVPFDPNTVSEALLDGLIAVGGTIKSLLTGDLASIEEYWESTYGDINIDMIESSKDYRFDEPGDYCIIIYVPGWQNQTLMDQAKANFSTSYLDRVIYAPYILKFAEELLQIIKIIADIKDLVEYDGHRGYSKSEELFHEVIMEKLVVDLAAEVNDLITAFENEDYLAVAKTFFGILVQLCKDTRFWEFLCRHYFLDALPGIITKELSDKMIHVVTKASKFIGTAILKWLAIADIAAVVAGEVERISLWVVEGCSFGPRDELGFTLGEGQEQGDSATGQTNRIDKPTVPPFDFQGNTQDLGPNAVQVDGLKLLLNRIERSGDEATLVFFAQMENPEMINACSSFDPEWHHNPPDREYSIKLFDDKGNEYVGSLPDILPHSMDSPANYGAMMRHLPTGIIFSDKATIDIPAYASITKVELTCDYVGFSYPQEDDIWELAQDSGVRPQLGYSGSWPQEEWFGAGEIKEFTSSVTITNNGLLCEDENYYLSFTLKNSGNSDFSITIRTCDFGWQDPDGKLFYESNGPLSWSHDIMVPSQGSDTISIYLCSEKDLAYIPRYIFTRISDFNIATADLVKYWIVATQ